LPYNREDRRTFLLKATRPTRSGYFLVVFLVVFFAAFFFAMALSPPFSKQMYEQQNYQSMIFSSAREKIFGALVKKYSPRRRRGAEKNKKSNSDLRKSACNLRHLRPLFSAPLRLRGCI